jgi:hypothetical protein
MTKAPPEMSGKAFLMGDWNSEKGARGPAVQRAVTIGMTGKGGFPEGHPEGSHQTFGSKSLDD